MQMKKINITSTTHCKPLYTLSKRDILLITGDLNAKVDTDRKGREREGEM